jgi:branched-chain amino acid transport system substrate-binding protein
LLRPGAIQPLIAVAGVAAVSALAGCGGGGGSSSTTTAAGIAGVPTDTCAKVEYGGEGKPAGLIVSDLPLQGDSAERSRQQEEAIRLMLDQRGWKAGSRPVAYQGCDDSIAKTGLWDAATCRSNADAYVDDDQVLGVIGTYNSGCAAEEIPILNRADVSMISPGNTAVCLTEPSKGCEGGQPDSLYPSGGRNYARVVPNDAFQGAALAEFAKQEGIAKPFVLYASNDPTSTGQAENFRGAAQALGLKLAGYETWDQGAKSYATLFGKVRRSGADGVVLAGLIEQNGAQLIQDKVEVVGSNSDLPLIAFDGFAQQATIDDSGPASKGMFASVPGSAPENLPAEGRAFVNDLRGKTNGEPVEQFAPYAGEAAAVLLDAIAKAGPNRAGIAQAVLATRGGGGILDRYDIEPSGDPSVGPITVLKADSSFSPFREVTPQADLVRAARG